MHNGYTYTTSSSSFGSGNSVASSRSASSNSISSISIFSALYLFSSIRIFSLRFGIGKIVSRYSIEEYEGVFKYAGIESVIGYHKLIMNEVAKNLSTTEQSSVHVMEQPGCHFLSFKLDNSSPIARKYYGDVVIPNGINIFAIRRNNTTLYPILTTKFEVGDIVLLLTHKIDPLQLTNLLGKNAPEF